MRVGGLVSFSRRSVAVATCSSPRADSVLKRTHLFLCRRFHNVVHNRGSLVLPTLYISFPHGIGWREPLRRVNALHTRVLHAFKCRFTRMTSCLGLRYFFAITSSSHAVCLHTYISFCRNSYSCLCCLHTVIYCFGLSPIGSIFLL